IGPFVGRMSVTAALVLVSGDSATPERAGRVCCSCAMPRQSNQARGWLRFANRPGPGVRCRSEASTASAGRVRRDRARLAERPERAAHLTAGARPVALPEGGAPAAPIAAPDLSAELQRGLDLGAPVPVDARAPREVRRKVVRERAPRGVPDAAGAVS